MGGGGGRRERSFLRNQYSHIGSSGADRHGDVGFEEFHTLLITTDIDNEHAERQSQKTSAANFCWAAFSGWLVVCVCGWVGGWVGVLTPPQRTLELFQTEWSAYGPFRAHR